MRINPISKITFQRKIIDSHAHVGNWYIIGENNTKVLKDLTSNLDTFLKSPLDNGDTVEKMLVSNLDTMIQRENDNIFSFLADEIEGNKKLLELAEKNSKIAPLATCQPGVGSEANIRNLLKSNPNKFVGLKFHPDNLRIPAGDGLYEPYMRLAEEYNLPCLFHSGSTIHSDPTKIAELAKKYKNVPVIISHWGAEYGGDYSKVTNSILESVKTNNSKIFADISWVDADNSAKPTIKWIIETLKEEKGALDRIVFGTDASLGRFGAEAKDAVAAHAAYSRAVQDVQAMIKKEFPDEAETIIDKIFYNNANRLFFEKETTSTSLPASIKKASSKKTALISGIIFTAFAALATYMFTKAKRDSDKQQNNIAKN